MLLGADLSWWDNRTSSIISSVPFLGFGNIPERRRGLGVNKCHVFVPWLMLNPAFPPIHSRCLSLLSPPPPAGNLSKTCTADGWTPPSIDYTGDCGYDPNDTVLENHEVSVGASALRLRLLFASVPTPLFLCAGGLLQRHQGGLHRGSQRVARFPDDRHHHTLLLPVSRIPVP